MRIIICNNPGKEVSHMYNTHNPADRYCEYLSRVCNLRSLPRVYKDYISNKFTEVQTVEDLRELCISIQDSLRPIAANPDYFTVE